MVAVAGCLCMLHASTYLVCDAFLVEIAHKLLRQKLIVHKVGPVWLPVREDTDEPDRPSHMSKKFRRLCEQCHVHAGSLPPLANKRRLLANTAQCCRMVRLAGVEVLAQEGPTIW